MVVIGIGSGARSGPGWEAQCTKPCANNRRQAVRLALTVRSASVSLADIRQAVRVAGYRMGAALHALRPVLGWGHDFSREKIDAYSGGLIN
jgi:hypothetical protein